MLICSFFRSCSILSLDLHLIIFCFIVFRPEKRKHKAMGSIIEENGLVEQRKRKKEKKINALIPSSNERQLSYGIVGGLREF